MKREFILLFRTVLLFVLVLLTNASPTQNKTVDSLQKVLQIQKEDTGKVNTLNAICENFRQRGDNENAVLYGKLALALAEKLNFKRGKGAAYYKIGASYLMQQNLTEAKKNIQLALQVFQQINDRSNIAKSFHVIGRVYGYERNFTEAFKNYSNALKQYEALNDKGGIAYCYLWISYMFAHQDNFGESIKYGYTALKYYEEAGNKQGIADALQTIGNAYMEQGNIEESLKSWLAALNIEEEIKNKLEIGRILRAVGDIYARQGKYDDALKSEFAALKIFREPGMPGWGPPFIYTGLGHIYEKLGDEAKEKETTEGKYRNALKNYSEALKGWEKGKMKLGVTEACIQLGSINFKLNNLPEAKRYLNKGLELAKEDNEKESLRDAYLTLSKVDSTEGKYKEAYLHFKNYLIYQDSVVNQEGSRKTLQAKLQYESEKKEAITRAEQESIKNRQFFIMASLGLLTLFVIAVAVIQWWHKQQKQKANVLLQQQKEELQNTLQQLKATQVQLIHSEKMASLGELTAGIAHEIQNPLNFVNNFSDVNTELLEELKTELGSGNQQEAVYLAEAIIVNEQKINHHGKRADAIVKGMLQHSQASSGKKEPTDINALADEYLRLSYHGFRAKDKDFNADFKTDFDKSIGKIEVVPQDIGRVLLNLYNNAFYAASLPSEGGFKKAEVPTVWVTTKRTSSPSGAGGLEISVRDNGPGIPSNIVDKIFQPFFTTKPTGQGTGLGLSLSYDIIKAHGGEIKVETEEGKGAVFAIELPT